MRKFKKGDIVTLSQDSQYYLKSATLSSSNPINIKGEVTNVSGEHTLPVYVKWENNTTNAYNHKDLIPFKMTIKKQKTGEFELKDGMYFTAIYKKNKVRGYVDDISGWGCETFVLCGKNFPNDVADENDGCGFPSYLDIKINTGDKTMAVLKKAGITNFVECKDKRQIAVIQRDKMPMFKGWLVRDTGDLLTFGCGAVILNKKEAKIFAEILFDCNDSNLIINYRDVERDDDGSAKEYYKMRKWLEDNWTPAQIKAFNNVCAQIEEEEDIDDLYPKDVKAFMSQF